MPTLPAVLRQKRRPGNQIPECRRVSSRCFGALSRDQIKLGDLLAFVLRRDQFGAPVELSDDVEDHLFASDLWDARDEQPAYSEVSLGAHVFRDQGVRCLSDAIMEEPVGMVRAQEEACPHRLPKLVA